MDEELKIYYEVMNERTEELKAVVSNLEDSEDKKRKELGDALYSIIPKSYEVSNLMLEIASVVGKIREKIDEKPKVLK